MRIYLGIFAVALLGISCASAQDTKEGYIPTLGFKVGIPVTDMFSTNSSSFASLPAGTNLSSFSISPGGGFSYHTPRYEFGVSAEFHLPKHLRFEVDGLFKRGGFDSALLYGSTGLLAYRPTSFNEWEIPGLFKYNVTLGHFRPFIDFGASYRHISTITEETNAPGFIQPAYSDNSIALHNRNSFGGVAGFGITFKKGPFELTPEARYTRWANQSFTYSGFQTNLNQGDVLLGVSF